MNEIQVKLGTYKGIEISAGKTQVSESEIRSELERARTYAMTKETKDGPAEDGDEVMMDFVGTFEGVPFEGGSGENCPLTLGSNTFIPGFEDQLLGVKAGDVVDVTVSFPENYPAPDCAGKEAVFKCTIHEVRSTVIPELTDEVVAQISPCKTVEEFRSYVEEQIRSFKADQSLQEKENECLQAVVDASEIILPEELIAERANELKQNILSQLQSTGNTLDQFLEYNGLTEETMDENMRLTAEQMLKGQGVLGMIAQEEGFTYEQEQVDAEVAKLAAGYQMPEDEFRKMIGETGVNMIAQDILNKQALDFIVAEAVEVE